MLQKKFHLGPFEFAHKGNVQLHKVEVQKFTPEMMRQIADRHAPGLANRGRSSGQRHILEMSGAFKVSIARDQHLAAPNISVGAIARAIQARIRLPGLRDGSPPYNSQCAHDGVGLQRVSTPLCSQRPPCGEVVGVEIVGNDFRPDFEDPLQMFDGLVEKIYNFPHFPNLQHADLRMRAFLW